MDKSLKEVVDQVTGLIDDATKPLVAELATVKKALAKTPVANGEAIFASPRDHKVEAMYGYKSFGHYAEQVRLACGKGGHAHHAAMNEQIGKGLALTKSQFGGYEKAVLGMSETVDSEGNWLIPPAFSQNIFERVYANDILSRTDQYSVQGRTIVFPANAETSRVDGSRSGGVLSYWADEGTAVTATKPTFRRFQLTLRKLMVFGVVTQELIEDSPQTVGSYLTNKFADEVTFQVGRAIVSNGDGVSKPRSILNSPAKISIAKESGQAAATIVPQNIWKMYARMWAPSRTNGVWLYNQDCEPALFSLKFDIGTAGVPLFVPPGGIKDSPYASLLGRPMVPSEFCQTLGTEGDLIFVDFSQYATITKGAPDTQMSMHLYFDSDQMAYRTIFRCDGDCWWNAALTPLNGTKTQSPIVTLATRS
jgi:HK97 family phage major capsid protein